ncbi:MAG: DsbA family protein [Acetobacteraceae bacterium]
MELTRRALGVVAIAALGGLPLARSAAAQARFRLEASGLVEPGDPVYGNPDGNVTIVDFYDLRCPPCRAFDAEARKLLGVDRFVRYVPIDYPVLGAPSVLGVKALFAAAMQGKYKPLRAMLMRQTEAPDLAQLKADGAEIGLDWPRLELAMNGDRVAHRVEHNLSRGRTLGIKGLPTLFIGPQKITGAPRYQDLRALVAEAEKEMAGSGHS